MIAGRALRERSRPMPDDPFKGIRLSDQTSVGKIDQRLFERAPTPAAIVDAPTSLETPEVATAPKELPPAKPKAASPAAVPSPAIGTTFNLNDEAKDKASFYFANEELLALDDLKVELHRELDKKVTKNDLVRSAL